MKRKKCGRKKVIKKMAEEGIKKAIEGIVLALVLGFSLKFMLAVPAVAFGAGIARVAVGQLVK